MKIVIPTRGTVERMKTVDLLGKMGLLDRAIFVCHTREQRSKILSAPGIVPQNVLVHGIPEALDALTIVRDWLEKNVLRDGEWYIGMDDNVIRLDSVVNSHYGELQIENDRSLFKKPIEKSLEFVFKMNELMLKCEKEKTIYGGVGWMENPMFRRTKWQSHGYVKSKVFVKKAQTIKWKWEPRVGLMHDHAMTFKVIAEYGCIVNNRFIYAHNKRWEKGGLGTREERMPARLPTRELMYEVFAGLVAPWKGNPDEPALCRRGRKSIDRWRKEHGYTRNLSCT